MVTTGNPKYKKMGRRQKGKDDKVVTWKIGKRK